MNPKEKWYLCSIVETDDSKPQPDWSKVPEAKREEIKAKWANQNKKPAQEQFMWGPQIKLANANEGTSVTVIREQTPDEAAGAITADLVPPGRLEEAREQARARALA